MNQSTPKETITTRFSWIKQYLTTENITIFTLVMYVWGYSYYYLYYKAFGINITKYISLQELLVETLVYVVLVTIFSTILIGAIYYFTLFLFILLKKNRARRYVAIKRNIYHSIYLLLFTEFQTLILFSIIITLELLLSSGYTLLRIDKEILVKFLYPTLSISSIYTSILLYKNHKSKMVKYTAPVFTVLIFALLINSLARSNAELSPIKNQNKFRTIEINTGQKYTTSDTLLYIGETNSTLFLFNKPANNTIIINKENVIQTTLIKHAKIKLKEKASTK